ncbi:hypothetical protein EJ05DRAFT_475756 [Pseudovirgaria hyperparasitica]|uniref:Uncharacterized protein n=1 Tax=Pseudovirgaria hyperparasitica TaxID=470096 RepID=A0A6A6W6A5_9PEZI|nr:uncharacterized protein EJ05DRAFT_475756 [Pseudovirgaria hyperparasitica]KAF2758448.1 hypothetical protein EJ05DRAFT_475756 [Pseudovirgaria hyperparasitica]
MAVDTTTTTTTTTTPTKSIHLADPSLAPFLNPTFDAATYFNTVLPTLSLTSTTTTTSNRQSQPPPTTPTASLAELSTQTQTLLSQLTAQTTRLSTILTQLTDDILRSGARLAYQVELLRGETISLTDTLAGPLSSTIETFVPGGFAAAQETTPEAHQHQPEPSPSAPNSPPAIDTDANATPTPAPTSAPKPTTDPEYITSLRTLTLVRTRLESVIQTFGDAMQWTLPPSSINTTSSLISVSAPEPGSSHASAEEKGRAFAEKLRNEIGDLVVLGEDGRGQKEGEAGGYEAALVRIDGLRELAGVWKGTAEEKARAKFVEDLAKLARERMKTLEGGAGKQQRRRQSSAAARQGTQSGGGFLDSLQRMRGNF